MRRARIWVKPTAAPASTALLLSHSLPCRTPANPKRHCYASARSWRRPADRSRLPQTGIGHAFGHERGIRIGIQNRGLSGDPPIRTRQLLQPANRHVHGGHGVQSGLHGGHRGLCDAQFDGQQGRRPDAKEQQHRHDGQRKDKGERARTAVPGSGRLGYKHRGTGERQGCESNEPAENNPSISHWYKKSMLAQNSRRVRRFVRPVRPTSAWTTPMPEPRSLLAGVPRERGT